MRFTSLITRNLAHFWRTNLAVVAGVAAAVAVLAGALVVGDSVRASLRGLFLQRLGATSYSVSAAGFFREELAMEVAAHDEFAAQDFVAACPLVALGASVAHEESGRRAGGVQVYGVDERFWKFHGRTDAEAKSPRGREMLLSAGLAEELGARAGDVLLVRVEKPSAIPAESLHGQKEDLGRTVRLTARESLDGAALGEFSLRPQQSAVRAVFVPLALLQKELEQEGRANTILISEKEGAAADADKTAVLERILRDRVSLEDLGIKLRALDAQKQISLESESALVNDSLASLARASADKQGARVSSVLSYLANTIRAGAREVPYSVVTAIDDESFNKLRTLNEAGTRNGFVGAGLVPARVLANPSGQKDLSLPLQTSPRPQIILNEWAARDLEARAGDKVSLEYFVWKADGRLATESAEFELAAVVPIAGAAADEDLVPAYPGITGTESLADWEPPFPVELARVRPQDEAYWDAHRTTPKAFVTLAEGQRLWGSRYGKLTSLRVTPADTSQLPVALENYRRDLRAALDPTRTGFAVTPVRAQGLEASRGATDFGEYFLYFSFFIVVSALLLASLFFKLGVEGRLREIGVLQAVGFPASRIRRIFLVEGFVLAAFGSVIGLAGAVLYGTLMMYGLRTWWVGAVGTTSLALHVSPASLLAGATGGIVAALACVAWTLRSLAKVSTRSMLTGTVKRDDGARSDGGRSDGRRKIFSSKRLAVVSGLLGAAFVAAAFFKLIGQAAGFFGGGVLFLVCALCYQTWWLARRGGAVKPIRGAGWWPVARLGFRNAARSPARSVLCVALIASAAFIVVSVDGFRRHDGEALTDRKSGGGGYALLAESALPLIHDPNSPEGREALNFVSSDDAETLSGISFARFRLRPGDDASCLNLYQPREPKIIAPTAGFINSNRFTFQDSLAATPEEKDNPWLLLEREHADGTIPVVADANSLTYILRRKLGDEIVLSGAREAEGGDVSGGSGGGSSQPVRLKLVGALSNSVLQSELVMSEKHFLRLFPEQEGYRFFLVDVRDANKISEATTTLEERLADFGFDAVGTNERLANFHRVENTFISTFQMLGGLGLLLGTLGMAAVLLRNVLERRRELALLRAVGYNRAHVGALILAENAFLLFTGLLIGTECALIATAPAAFARGAWFPTLSFALGAMLLAVLVSGLAASLAATVAALRSPLLRALRSE